MHGYTSEASFPRADAVCVIISVGADGATMRSWSSPEQSRRSQAYVH
jgi:hypothetical protein